MLYLISIMAGLCPLGLFIFTRCITNTLDSFLCWILSRVQYGQSWGICSWGLLKCLLSNWAARVSPPEVLGGPRSCRWVFVVVCSPGGFVPLFSVLRDYLNLLDWMTCDCKQCPRKSFPCLLLLLSRDEEGLMGFSSLLSDGLTSMDVFTKILWVKRY